MNEEKFCRRCEEPVEEKVPGCPLQCGSEKCASYKKKKPIDYFKIPIIWVIGGPGSGKGDQCSKIASKFGYTHLSTGKLLREEVARGTDRAKCLLSVLEHGTLAPDDLVLGLLKESMEARIQSAKGFVIEGYPRTLRQGIAFEKTLTPANAIIFLDAHRDVLETRLRNRPHAATISEVETRNFINTRLKFFYDNYQKILDQFPNILTKVDADKPVEEIFGKVTAAINAMVAVMKEKQNQKELEEKEDEEQRKQEKERMDALGKVKKRSKEAE